MSSIRLKSALTLLGPFIALLVVYTIFGMMNSAMFTRDVLLSLLTQTVIVGTAAIGMTLIIIAGGIDLSVGSIIALCGVFAATLVTRGYSAPVVFLATIAFGGCRGLVNGALTAGLRLLPFIITLGTMQVFRGAAKVATQGTPVNLPFDVISFKP